MEQLRTLKAQTKPVSASFGIFSAIRYRFERVRELTGLDVSSIDGREKLSLGLKAMRVLGIALPGGPATEPGAEGGRVRR